MGIGAGTAALIVGALSAGAAVYSADQAASSQSHALADQKMARARADAESRRLAQQAEAEAQRLRNIEAETKRKTKVLANKASSLPDTIATSFSGLKAPAQTFKKKLLGQ